MTGDITVIVKPYLPPPSTILCSPDVYEVLKAAVDRTNEQGGEVKK